MTAVEGALRTSAADRPDADELALALFESTTAQPLELAERGGDDDLALLTRRIRAAARSTSERAASVDPRPRRWREWLRPGERRVGRRRFDGLRLGWRRADWHRIAPWVAVVLVMVLAGGLLAWHGTRDEAQATTSPADTPTAVQADIRMLADAPLRDPKALAQALADARASAWSSGVAARLVEVDAPRSPALARDTEVLAEVQRSGQRYVGLSFVVRDAGLATGSGDRATLRAAIDTSAHVVRGPRGDVSRPAVAGPPVLLDLVRTPSGWRVAEVRAVP